MSLLFNNDLTLVAAARSAINQRFAVVQLPAAFGLPYSTYSIPQPREAQSSCVIFQGTKAQTLFWASGSLAQDGCHQSRSDLPLEDDLRGARHEGIAA